MAAMLEAGRLCDFHHTMAFVGSAMFFFFFFGAKGKKETRGAQEPKAQPIPDFGGKPPGYKILTEEILDKRDALEQGRAIMTTKPVAEMTVAEFEERVRAIVTQTLSELVADPDEGLELSEWASARLQKSVDGVAAGEPTIPLEEVACRYGLSR